MHTSTNRGDGLLSPVLTSSFLVEDGLISHRHTKQTELLKLFPLKQFFVEGFI